MEFGVEYLPELRFADSADHHGPQAQGRDGQCDRLGCGPCFEEGEVAPSEVFVILTPELRGAVVRSEGCLFRRRLADCLRPCVGVRWSVWMSRGCESGGVTASDLVL